MGATPTRSSRAPTADALPVGWPTGSRSSTTAGTAGIPGGASPHWPASRHRHQGRRRQRAHLLGRYRLAQKVTADPAAAIIRRIAARAR